MRIVQAEDERRWDADLNGLLSDRNAAVRARAALAAGRIGDERAVPNLISMLQKDQDGNVRMMAAFALGETETAAAGDALAAELSKRIPARERARIVEALGKITAALPATDETRLNLFRKEIIVVLEFEAKRAGPDSDLILIGLTAALRARPAGVGKVIAEFLTFGDARIRAHAANALARLRANEGNERLRGLLANDPDPVVRANAARALGATGDKNAIDGLLVRALKDTDSRVRVSAIRAFAALKDDPAAKPLFGNFLANARCARHVVKRGSMASPYRNAECLEIATALGRIFQGSENEEVLAQLRSWNVDFSGSAPEIEIALVRLSPSKYLKNLGDEVTSKRKAQETLLLNWTAASGLAQGLAEIAALPDTTAAKVQLAEQAQEILRAMLDYRNSGITINTLVAVHSEYAVPDVLRAFAAFKPKDLNNVLIAHLDETDVVIRATAAELLAELPPNEGNASGLIKALSVALSDKQNDAALSILESLGKQKSTFANEAIKTALDSSDYLVRRNAAALLKMNGEGNFSPRVGTVRTRNTIVDYQRALSRIGTSVRAIVSTTKGSFTIELLPDDAPLTVDNFVQLAKRGYFKGITVHRVVPNFVVQDGDPRGDGNGGPGYSIRCEINQVTYDRGAVGMALSGKDTGGSQWFVTHSPQPHLDGGYTMFGRVLSGMEVVDDIARGDVIRDIVITDNQRRVAGTGN
ncbi:MAG: peptidylprolyl isomerase [Pyrinomonadaceae bacterium]